MAEPPDTYSPDVHGTDDNAAAGSSSSANAVDTDVVDAGTSPPAAMAPAAVLASEPQEPPPTPPKVAPPTLARLNLPTPAVPATAWLLGRPFTPMPTSGFNVSAGLAAACASPTEAPAKSAAVAAEDDGPRPMPAPTPTPPPPPAAAPARAASVRSSLSLSTSLSGLASLARRLTVTSGGSASATFLAALAPEEAAEQTRFALAAYDVVAFTYRTGLTPIGHTNLTSDTGWGCMLRSGQMLVCTALMRNLVGEAGLATLREHRLRARRHRLSAAWGASKGRRQTVAPSGPDGSGELTITPTPDSPPPPLDDTASPALNAYRQVLGWFHDTPDAHAPYSIHSLAIRGANLGIDVGQWHGPHTTAHIFVDLMQQHRPGGMTAVMAIDGTVYCDDVIAQCTTSDSDGTSTH